VIEAPVIDASDRNIFTQHIVQFFSNDDGHLSENLQPIIESFEGLLDELLEMLPDGIEFTAGLRKLLEAKDCFVRHAFIEGMREVDNA
jgi:hypothetical protein